MGIQAETDQKHMVFTDFDDQEPLLSLNLSVDNRVHIALI
jgi:hypothetical protein